MNDTAIPKKTAPPPAELLSVVEISTSILPQSFDQVILWIKTPCLNSSAQLEGKNMNKPSLWTT